MYFDTPEECEAWAEEYQHHQWYDLGNKDFGAAYGVGRCGCGKLYVTHFY